MARINRVFSRRNRSSGLAGIKVGRKNDPRNFTHFELQTANISNRFSLVLSHAVVYFATESYIVSAQGISKLFTRRNLYHELQ